MAQAAQPHRFELEDDCRIAVEQLRRRPLSLPELAMMVGHRRAELLLYCMLITKQVELVQSSSQIYPPPVAPAGLAGRVTVPPISYTTRAADPVAKSTPPARPAAYSTPAPSGATAHAATSTSSPAAARATTSVPPQRVTHAPLRNPVSGSQVRPTDEFSERRLAIHTRARLIQAEDHFQRLGLSRDATLPQIEAAFAALRAQWEPASLPLELDDSRDDCWLVLSCMSEAYATLTDPQQGARYRDALKRGIALPGGDQHSDDLEISGAKDALSGARVCFERQDMARAERLCAHAHRADPNNAEALALLAWIEAHQPANQNPEGIRKRIVMLSRALDLDVFCESALLWRAQLFKRIEHHAAAIRDFRRILSTNERHLEAERELRIYEMRLRNHSISVRRSTPSGGTKRTSTSSS
jgi:hypothetical protein